MFRWYRIFPTTNDRFVQLKMVSDTIEDDDTTRIFTAMINTRDPTLGFAQMIKTKDINNKQHDDVVQKVCEEVVDTIL